MMGIFKNLFSQSDNNLLKQAIRDGAFLVDVRTPEEFFEGSKRRCKYSSRQSIKSNIKI